MKRSIFVAALIGVLALAGCAGPDSTGAGRVVGQLLTGTLENPARPVDIYRVKNGYAIALQAAAAWREYCWSKSYAALMRDAIARPVCQNRRPTLRRIQSARAKAGSAVRSAEDFVANNPTLSAVSIISAAMSAVGSFQNAVPSR